MPGANVFTTLVVPICGNILGAMLLASPMKAMFTIRKTGTLGELNSLPYPLTFMNCVGWVAYGYVSRDIFLIPANLGGAACGIFFTFTAYGVASKTLQDQLNALITLSLIYFGILGSLSALVLSTTASVRLWGLSSNIVLLVYYASPLATLWKIIVTRNAESIYLPLAVMAIANGSMWFIYGLAIADINLWPINGVGAALGVLQVVLKLVFIGSKSRQIGGSAPSDGAMHVSLPSLCDSETGLQMTSENDRLLIRSNSSGMGGKLGPHYGQNSA